MKGIYEKHTTLMLHEWRLKVRLLSVQSSKSVKLPCFLSIDIKLFLSDASKLGICAVALTYKQKVTQTFGGRDKTTRFDIRIKSQSSSLLLS